MFSRLYLGESSAMTPVWDGRELLSSAAIKKSTFLSTASPLYPPHVTLGRDLSVLGQNDSHV